MKAINLALSALAIFAVTGAANADNKKLALLTGIAGDPGYISMECGAAAVAREHGYTLNTQGPQKWDAALQRPILDSIIAANPQGLIVVPNDESALQRSLAQAQAQGMKIALADTSTKDPSVAVSEVTSDSQAIGELAYQAVKELAPQGGKVLALGAAPGVTTSDERIGALLKALAADSKYKALDVQYAQTDTARASQLVAAALQRNPDIVAIFSVDNITSDGAAAAVRQANLSGKVQVISVDAVPGQIDGMRKDITQGLIAQKLYEVGAKSAEQVIAAIEGRPTQSIIKTGSFLITKANVDTPQAKAAVYMTECQY